MNFRTHELTSYQLNSSLTHIFYTIMYAYIRKEKNRQTKIKSIILKIPLLTSKENNYEMGNILIMKNTLYHNMLKMFLSNQLQTCNHSIHLCMQHISMVNLQSKNHIIIYIRFVPLTGCVMWRLLCDRKLWCYLVIIVGWIEFIQIIESILVKILK